MSEARNDDIYVDVDSLTATETLSPQVQFQNRNLFRYDHWNPPLLNCTIRGGSPKLLNTELRKVAGSFKTVTI